MRSGGRTVRVGWALPAGLGLGALAAVLVGAWVGTLDGGGDGGAGTGVVRSGAGLAVAVARLATDGLGAAGIGLALLPLLLDGRATGRERAGADPGVRARSAALRRAARLGVLLGAGWAMAALLALWLQAADAAGTGPFEVSPVVLGDYAGEVAAGRGVLLTLGCAVLLMCLQLSALVRWARAAAPAHPGRGSRTGQVDRPRYPELALGAGLLGMLAGPVTGHAAGHDSHDPAVLAIALHVVAASGWVGGLLAIVLVLAGQPRLVAVALPRFSTVAGYCAGTVAVTGVLSAVFRLPTPVALVNTGYGLLVLAKAACLVVLLGLGWRARRRLLGRMAGLTGGGSGSPVPLARWLGLELVVMAVVFGLAAALAGAAP
jgi:putative copper resistance protein D